MAINSKQSFMREIETRCADALTVADMARLMTIVSDVLEGYRMEEIMPESRALEDNDMLRAFIDSLSVQGRSEKTIERYNLIIRLFMEHAKAPTRAITVYHIRDWLASMKSRGLQDSTLSGNRAVLSSYFGWLYREGLIDRNPIANVGAIKVAKKVKRTYSDIDIEKLNQKCDTLRDKTIIHFLRSTGCRISEAVSLDRCKVDIDKLECVVHGKGNKDRTVFMDAVTGMLLSEYLKTRTDDNPALFISKRGGGRLQAGGVRRMLKQIGEEAGVDHVHPHKFRRTLATDLARHGMPIQEVVVLLGHEKIDTTMGYIVLNQDDTKHDYRRYA